VTTIVCSITDHQSVEENRLASLGLIAGQEKLNNQCWFQLTPQRQEMLQIAHDMQSPDRTSTEDNLNKMLLQQLEDFVAGRPSTLGKDSAAAKGRSSSKVDSRRSHSSVLGAKRGTGHFSISGDSSADSKRGTGKMSAMLTAATLAKLQPSNIAKHGKSGKYSGRPHPRIGTMNPEDPFFWFCSQNYALHTYPADKIPKHFLGDGACLVYQYADFVSRTGTPDPSQQNPAGLGQGPGSRTSSRGPSRQASIKGDDWDREAMEQKDSLQQPRSICRPVVPPAICLCQPTDLTSHKRQRWTVKLDFVDQQKLVLGDTGWWPGALGNYFDFETQLDNVDRYITASEVPQTRLLYVESVRLPDTQKSKKKGQPPKVEDVCEPSSSGSGSESEGVKGVGSEQNRHASATSGAVRRAVHKAKKTLRPGRRTDLGQTKPPATEDTSSLMLPPLLQQR